MESYQRALFFHYFDNRTENMLIKIAIQESKYEYNIADNLQISGQVEQYYYHFLNPRFSDLLSFVCLLSHIQNLLFLGPSLKTSFYLFLRLSFLIGNYFPIALPAILTSQSLFFSPFTPLLLLSNYLLLFFAQLLANFQFDYQRTFLYYFYFFEMKKIFILLVYILVSRQASSYFFNLGSFLEPVLNPKLDTFGSATYKFSFHSQEHVTTFDSSANRDKLNAKVDMSKNINTNNLRRENNNDNTASDLYKAIGIPEDVIYNRIIPVHTAARRDLNRFFFKFSISSLVLYESLKQLKETIEWITSTYLQNINTVILGDDNDIIGSKIYLKGDNQTVRGQSNFIFNPKYSNIPVKGNNIVRIGQFDVDLDYVEMVKRNPFQAVKILQLNVPRNRFGK